MIFKVYTKNTKTTKKDGGNMKRLIVTCTVSSADYSEPQIVYSKERESDKTEEEAKDVMEKVFESTKIEYNEHLTVETLMIENDNQKTIGKLEK